MSTYTEIVTEFKSVEDLQAALAKCGLEYEVYPESDGVYHKWARRGGDKNMMGAVRGSDAALVVHGGIDTTARRFCGDTAFVWEGDTLRAKRDIAHGNAPENWTNIVNNYALVGVERQAAKYGMEVEQVQAADGKITLRLYKRSRSVVRRRMMQQRRGA